MGKATRIKQQSAREKVAAQREAARKAERRNRIMITGGSTLVVLVIVAAFIVIKLSQGSPSSSGGSSTGTLLPASVSSQVTGVPAATLDRVGKGAVPTFTRGQPALAPGSGAALTSGGKPQMLYIGAEYCPYCAATRWSMAVALSRFGTLTPLHGIHSSSTDAFPNTATLTFFGSTYTSNYLVFTPVETQDVNHNPLQTPTAAQKALWAKYEPPGNSYPFIDIGNRYVATTTYNPQVLQGLSWNQIATDLHNPSSPVAQGAVGSANLLTAAICKITGNAPASVCTAAPFPAIESRLALR